MAETASILRRGLRRVGTTWAQAGADVLAGGKAVDTGGDRRPGDRRVVGASHRMSVSADGEVSIRGRSLFVDDSAALLDRLDELVASGQKHLIVTPNVDQVVLLESEPEARRAFNEATLRTIDGAPLVFLAKLLGARSCNRNTGADLLNDCARESADRKWRISIVGGAPGVGAKAAENLNRLYPGADVHHISIPRIEDMAPDDFTKVNAKLRHLNADLTFVCLGFPKQESWVLDHLEQIPSSVYIGAGAAVDFAAGEIDRAPDLMQTLGLEWAFRLISEPKRLWRRYLIRGWGFVPFAVRSLSSAGRYRLLEFLPARSNSQATAVVNSQLPSEVNERKNNMVGDGRSLGFAVDRLIVHQFDIAQTSPGGIDTCIRGLCRYLPAGESLAIVGVDAVSDSGRKLGIWESHQIGDRTVHFLPVARFDPADQSRKVPHSVRLAAGLIRYQKRLPQALLVQAHRADMAAVVLGLRLAPFAYFVHTQEKGLTGENSDSIWKRAAAVHQRVERLVMKRSDSVTVFNEEHAKQVSGLNTRTMFSPTWFDPGNIFDGESKKAQRVVWAGRLERPKDPELAIDSVSRLIERDPSGDWTLDLYGFGSQLEALEAHIQALPEETLSRIRLCGRVSQKELSLQMANGGVFLMTSHPGYEGYPRVLVEALASGLPAVVTEGADTGGLVVDGVNGATVYSRSIDALAEAIQRASTVDRVKVSESVRHLGAPEVVLRIHDHTATVSRSFGAAGSSTSEFDMEQQR